MKPSTYEAFYCYDSKLSVHLRNKGFTCLTIAKNRQTNNLFSVYVRDEALKNELKQYNLNLIK